MDSRILLVVVIGVLQLVFPSSHFFLWCSKLLKHFIRPVNSMTKMNPLFKARYLYKPLQHMNSGTLALDKPSLIIIPVLMKSNLAVSLSKQCLCNCECRIARTYFNHMIILSEAEHMHQCGTLKRCSLEHHKPKRMLSPWLMTKNTDNSFNQSKHERAGHDWFCFYF